MTIFVHGIFSLNGGKWGDMKKEFPNIKVFDYGWVGPLTTIRRSKVAGENLSVFIDGGEDVIAFSNGALVVEWAIKMGALPGKVAYIQPALSKSTPINPNITVLHNHSDWIVQLSRLWGWLSGWDGHPWGSMGFYGADNAINVDTGEYGIAGHRGWKKYPKTTSNLIKESWVDLGL